MTTPSEFTEALARLDAEIADTEARLADLRLKRKGAEAFLAYMSEPPTPRVLRPVATAPEKQAADVSAGPAEAVLAALRPDVAYTVDTALAATRDAGHELERIQVRNALSYLMRKHQVAGVRRGVYRLNTTEAPAATGASGHDPANSEGGEGGEDEPTSTSTAADLDQPHLGTAIGG